MTQAALLIKIIAVFALHVGISLQAATPVFCPPKGWKPVDSPSPRIKASFLLKTKKNLSPSLNFTIEEFSRTPEEYLISLEKLYTNHSDHRFRRLGILETKTGKSYLTSLDMTTPAGKIRVLQSILFKDAKVYVLTGALAAEDFGSYQEDLIKTFSSITFVDHLEQYIEGDKKKDLFAKKASLILSNKDLPSFTKFLEKEFSEEGPHWQSLAVQELLKKIEANLTGK